ETDLGDISEMIEQLEQIARVLYGRIERAKSYGRTLTIKIKFEDFKQITRSKTFASEIDSYELLWDCTTEIFNKLDLSGYKVRLLGVSVSNFVSDDNSSKPLQLTFDF
ncbi:MAG: hypothetical protein P1P88_21195, partial [Bacteroidales bacterium]|nr:hypothetical protein [Bacteroidales bacterium]